MIAIVMPSMLALLVFSHLLFLAICLRAFLRRAEHEISPRKARPTGSVFYANPQGAGKSILVKMTVALPTAKYPYRSIVVEAKKWRKSA